MKDKIDASEDRPLGTTEIPTDDLTMCARHSLRDALDDKKEFCECDKEWKAQTKKHKPMNDKKKWFKFKKFHNKALKQLDEDHIESDSNRRAGRAKMAISED